MLPDHARPSRRSQAHEQGGEAPSIPARVATHADAPLADVPAPARAEEHGWWRERHPAPGSGRAMVQIVVTLAADGAAEDLPEWRAFTGQTREAAHGRGWLDALHPADRAHAIRLWEAQEPADAPREAEVRIRREDGAYRAFVARLAPLPAAGGAERAWVGIFTD
ncbi:MAG TPA: PAS domain-containing protein, partial [Ktedonobacterales bacterium]|nr:PAS domain-containing protein [Ktedonobacterales bacterium]